MGQLLVEKMFWETGYEGFPFMVFILAIIGLWKSDNKFLKVWFLFNIITTMLLWRFFFYSLFSVPIIAASGLAFLKRGTGSYGTILKALVMLYVIMAGFLFTLEFTTSYPIPKQTRAFEWIRENTPENATILSDWTYGHWISGMAYRRNFMDGYAEYAPEADQRMEALQDFFDNCTIPEGYGITHIYMEEWIITQLHAECIYDNFDAVFNESEIFVFEI
jgi:hypothetical protein